MIKNTTLLLAALVSFNSFSDELTKPILPHVKPAIVSIQQGCNYGGWISKKDSAKFIAICEGQYYDATTTDLAGNLDDVLVVYKEQKEKIILSSQ